MCDYGIFEVGSKNLSYRQLFDVYEQARADFGIMQDFLCDSKRTLVSAARAVEEYDRKPRAFRLVLVAQGKSVQEYVRCYEGLNAMGAEYIAIGGLLRKRPRSARYMYVSSEAELAAVLEAIRSQFRPKWLFVLGAYHPSRHALLQSHGVYGSDYKGWIFQYEHRRDMLSRLHERLKKIESSISVPDDALSYNVATRDMIAETARVERLLYIRTRNTSEDNSRRKAVTRRRLIRLQGRLSDADQSLVEARMTLAAKNGLPSTYKRTLARFASVFKSDDQSVRVRGVHKYLEQHVYSQ
jgi:hypothetical protein